MKIVGATVGTTIPKPNFDQRDPRKGDYIKGDRSFLQIDDTLTLSGRPADSKATGDAINNLQANIDQVDSKLSEKADITAIPSIDGLATEDYVDKAIASIDFPVDSVNGKTGTVVLEASDVGAPTVAEMNAAIAAIPTPDVSGQINTHNTSATAHSDIRQALSNKANMSDIPDTLAELTADSTHRTVTDEEKKVWNEKSDFSGDYNDLTNKPSIPSIEGLATVVYVDSEVSKKADKDHSHSNYVPISRTVNGKTLTDDIELSASDVGAAYASNNIVNGTEVVVNNALQNSIANINLYGETRQKNGTGAQMFDCSAVKGGTVNGVSLSASGDYLTYKGTATSSGQSTLATLSQYITLSPGTYTLSVDKPLPMRVRFNTTSFLVLRAGETSVTSTLTEEFVIKNIAIHYASGVEYNETFRLMLNEGSEALPWEPYTGGLPGPMPNNPQELKSTGDSGLINVSVCGANLARGYADVSSTNKGVTTKRHKDHAYVDISGTATGLISLALVGDYDQSKIGEKILYLPAGTYKFVVPSEYHRVVKYRKSATGTTIYNMDANNTFTLTEGTWLSNIWFDIAEGDVFPEGYRFHYGLYREGDVPAEWIDYQNGGSINIETPNGLPGVPVESCGNYTDENGQQWLCDEIDFTRGVYIKRCAVDVLDIDSTQEDVGNYFNYNTREFAFVDDCEYVLFECNYTGVAGAYCNLLPVTTNRDDVGVKDCLYIGEPDGFVISPVSSESFKGFGIGFFAAEMTDNGTPITVIRGMTSEYWTEIPLTEEQLAAFRSIRNEAGTVIVSSDAFMSVEFSGAASAKDISSHTHSVTVTGTNSSSTVTGTVSVPTVTPTSKKLKATASGAAVGANGTAAAITGFGAHTTAAAITALNTTTINNPSVTDGTAASFTSSVDSNGVLSFSFTANTPTKVSTSSKTVVTGSKTTANAITALGTPATSTVLTGVKVITQPTVTLALGDSGDVSVVSGVSVGSTNASLANGSAAAQTWKQASGSTGTPS